MPSIASGSIIPRTGDIITSPEDHERPNLLRISAWKIVVQLEPVDGTILEIYNGETILVLRFRTRERCFRQVVEVQRRAGDQCDGSVSIVSLVS